MNETEPMNLDELLNSIFQNGDVDEFARLLESKKMVDAAYEQVLNFTLGMLNAGYERSDLGISMIKTAAIMAENEGVSKDQFLAYAGGLFDWAVKAAEMQTTVDAE